MLKIREIKKCECIKPIMVNDNGVLYRLTNRIYEYTESLSLIYKY